MAGREEREEERKGGMNERGRERGEKTEREAGGESERGARTLARNTPKRSDKSISG